MLNKEMRSACDAICDHITAHGPVHAYELQEHFHISGPDLRAVINRLRTEGFLICSGARGYWYAENEEEAEAVIADLEHRQAGLAAACAGLSEGVRNTFHAV